MGEWLAGDVDTVQMWDAEYCPDPVPAGPPACMVYIGGSSAGHVWDAAELARVEHLARLPVWVPTPGVDDPRASAAACLARLRELGVPTFAQVGYHPRIMVDLETGREPDWPWLSVFRSRLHAAGYYTCPYCDLSVLLAANSYQPCAGFVVANPSTPPVPHLYRHPAVVGTQYAFDVRTPGGPVDLSMITTDLLGVLWAPTVTPPAPTPGQQAASALAGALGTPRV